MSQSLWERFWSIAGAVTVRWKIVGIVVAVIVILGASITLHLARSYETVLRTQIEEKGVALGRSLAARSDNLILTNQRFALFELAQEIQRSGEDVLYVFIADPSGEPIVHTFGGGFPRGLLELAAPAAHEPYGVTRLRTEQGIIQDISVPILEGRGGIAHIGMSESRVMGYVSENVRTSILIIAVVLLLGVVGAYALATVLTRPVRQLVAATDAVGRGDFSERAPVWAEDEIGQLGTAFNRMASQLHLSSEALLQRNRGLEALNAVAYAANRTLEPSFVIETAIDESLGLSGAQGAWVSLLDEMSGQLSFAAQSGLSARMEALARRLDGQQCRCLRPSDAAEDGSRVQVCHYLQATIGRGAEDTHFVCVPLRSRGRPLGALTIVQRSEARLDEQQSQLLAAIGEQVGVALENARLMSELRRKDATRGQLLEKVITAQEDERKRIARELHDETGQALTSLAVSLKGLEVLHLPREARANLGLVQSMVAAALRGVQELALQLRPSVLDEAGLAPAIDRYVRGFADRYGIPVELQVIGMQRRLPAATETALYRITQEALTNVARHSRASHVSVLLERRTGSVVLLIEDDGHGFLLPTLRDEGRELLGIHGMEERAMLAGGRLTLESAPDSGTSVHVEFPVGD